MTADAFEAPDGELVKPETVIQPRKSTRKVRLTAHQQKLLKDYQEGVERRAREAEQAAKAPPVEHEARSRFSHSAEPINEKRQSAFDGPPPPEFDPEEPAVPEGKFVTATGFAAQQANNKKRRPPTGLNLAPRKKVRVAG